MDVTMSYTVILHLFDDLSVVSRQSRCAEREYEDVRNEVEA